MSRGARPFLPLLQALALHVTDLLSESPLAKQLIKLCSIPGRSAGDAPASQPCPEPAPEQELCAVRWDGESCLASPRSKVLLGRYGAQYPRTGTLMSPALAGLRTEGSWWDHPALPPALSLASARPGSRERTCTNIIVVIIAHKYMQALNDLGMERFLGINDQLALMVLSCTSGHQLLPAHH